MREMAPVAVPMAPNIEEGMVGEGVGVGGGISSRSAINLAAQHINRVKHSVLLDNLRHDAREADSAWLLSGSTPSAARWLSWRGGLGRRVEFSREQFIDAF
jgi:hypothetical protein